METYYRVTLEELQRLRSLKDFNECTKIINEVIGRDPLEQLRRMEAVLKR